MKRLIILFLSILFLLCGCTSAPEATDIAATTLPIWEFTSRLCDGTGLTVSRLITENVSCLHDYSLNVRQVQAVEQADLVVISGAGLEEFMEDLLSNKATIDASSGISLLESCHDHDHADAHHHHEEDAHIWLDPHNAATMVKNIHAGLCAQYPQHRAIFGQNLQTLLAEIAELEVYGIQQLENLSHRELITFHDGFSYLAHAYDLSILEAIEEESGAEASAAELIELISLVQEHRLPAIFVEANGSTSAAQIISAETGKPVYSLDMAMGGESWFAAMYHNIDTLKEALQ